MESTNSSITKPLYRITQIVWYILGIIQILLAFRFILKLFGANDTAWFTSFIYEVTSVLTSPFFNVFSVTKIAGVTIEWTTLLAMLVYWVLAIGIIKLILMGKTVSTEEAAEKLNDEEK